MKGERKNEEINSDYKDSEKTQCFAKYTHYSKSNKNEIEISARE